MRDSRNPRRPVQRLVIAGLIYLAALVLAGKLHWGSGAMVFFTSLWLLDVIREIWRAHQARVSTPQIRFEDGTGYERYMGKWSQLAGETFLAWLAQNPGLRWLDVGCGNGAFTELLVERSAPASVDGVDPSEAQLAYARTRSGARIAQFHHGDAMALPFADDVFDVAVMPLVIFFVSDPAKGVSEMARVVCTGGIVAAYAWDLIGGGFPYGTLQAEMRSLGVPVPSPPSPDASRIDTLRDLWRAAGLEEIETRKITVQRTFVDFDDYWSTILLGPSVARSLAAMAPNAIAQLQARMRAHLPANAAGRIACLAVANAIRGRVPSTRSPES